MKGQVMIEFALTFSIIFGLLVMLIFVTGEKIETIQKNNEIRYKLVKCYQTSDYILNEFSMNPNELNLTKVKDFVEENNLFVKFTNTNGEFSYGNYTSGNKISIRRVVIINGTLTFMDLVCRE